MGGLSATFHCPFCDHEMGEGIAGPNYTPVDAAFRHGQSLVISCSSCERALGGVFIPTPAPLSS